MQGVAIPTTARQRIVVSPQHGRIVRPNGTECFRRYYWFGLHSLKQFSASQHNLLTNSLAGRLLFNAADWPAYRPIKSPSPVSFNRAVNIDCAGKGRGSSFSCSSSVVSRFWINRAGFPVTNLVTKVFHLWRPTTPCDVLDGHLLLHCSKKQSLFVLRWRLA